MVIQWSDDDQVYVVTLPEFGGCKTHGASYEKAAKQGRDAIESLLLAYEEDGDPAPAPSIFQSQIPLQ
jgi:predicted RNase H-like HicB family nuclease